MRERDNNTKFYHASLLQKRASLAIKRIRTAKEDNIEGDDNIGAATIEFFKALLVEVSPINNHAT